MFTQYTDKLKNPSFPTIKKQIFLRFYNEEYTKLKEDLTLYKIDKQDMYAFFDKEGFNLLNWAIISAPNAKSLSFLCENFKQDTLKKFLNHKNFYILESFLLGESNGENLNWYNSNDKSVQIEKFKLLLSIDEIGVKKFIETHAAEKYMTSEIKNNLELALQAHEEEKPYKMI